MDLNCGNRIITKQIMRCDLLKGRKTEHFRIFGIDGKTTLKIEIPKKPLVGTMRLYDISTTSYSRYMSARHAVDKKTRIP